VSREIEEILVTTLLLARHRQYVKMVEVCTKAGEHYGAKENKIRADECLEIHDILVNIGKYSTSDALTVPFKIDSYQKMNENEPY